MAFSFTYNPLNYQEAQKQIAAQLDPLYQRAIENVQKQKYQNDVQSGQLSAARGLGHSGLAADLLNKNNIAAQSSIGDINTQRATQLAQLSSDLMQRDQERAMNARAQAFQEYSSDRDYNYQVSRDKVSDMWKQKEWSEMSPAEKARMALEYQYSKKSRSGGGGGRKKKTTSTPTSLPDTPSAQRLENTYEFYQKILENGKKGQTSTKMFKGPTPLAGW